MNKTLLILVFLFGFSALSLLGQTPEPVRVGVFLDMSGETSNFGIASYNGIKMAVAEINAEGGVNGQKLEIFLEDDVGRPEKAREAVNKLIVERSVHVLLGEVASTNSLAAAPVAQEARIPMITPSSTNNRVTLVGDYIFRVCFVDPFQGEGMARFVFNELKLRRVAILGDGSSNYSKGLAKNFRETFEKLGGQISLELEYVQSIDRTFKKQLRSIRRTKPEALYLPGYYNEVGTIAREARQLGINTPLLGGDGWNSPELWNLGGDALKNSYIANHFAADDPSLAVQNFVRKYKAAYGADPDSIAALGYDAVYVLANALGRARSTDGEKLRDALAGTRDFSGVTGKIRNFGIERNPIKPVIILKLDEKAANFGYYSTVQR